MSMKDGWVDSFAIVRQVCFSVLLCLLLFMLNFMNQPENGEQSYFFKYLQLQLLFQTQIYEELLEQRRWNRVSVLKWVCPSRYLLEEPAKTSTRTRHVLVLNGRMCQEMRKDLKHSARNKKKGGSCWSQSHRTATQTEIYDTKEASCDKNNTSRNTSTTLYDDDATENVQLWLYLQTARRESTAPLPVLKVRRETGERTRVKESESKENAAEK